jgi:hypothetical protein
MEWECTDHDDFQNLAFGFNEYKDDSLSSTMATSGCSPDLSTRNNNRADKPDADFALTGDFQEHDVLLNAGRFSNIFKKGSLFYREQLDMLRPIFRETERGEEQQHIVHTLLESVWAQDGRFLVLEPKSGRISTPSNAMAASLVRKDLHRGPNKEARVVEQQKEKPKKQTNRGGTSRTPSLRKKQNGANVETTNKKKAPAAATANNKKKAPTAATTNKKKKAPAAAAKRSAKRKAKKAVRRPRQENKN